MPVDGIPTAEEVADADFPDVSELVEAIEDVIEAGDALRVDHPDLPLPDDEAGRRWVAAFERLRALHNRSQAAMEEFF